MSEHAARVGLDGNAGVDDRPSLAEALRNFLRVKAAAVHCVESPRSVQRIRIGSETALREKGGGNAIFRRAPNVKRVVATGPGGAAWTDDEGETWTRLPGVRDYWAVAFANQEVGWLVGTEGRILKIAF